MDLDIDVPFESLCTGSSFRWDLAELQSMVGTRDIYQSWARDLRYITPAQGFTLHENELKVLDSDEQNLELCQCSSSLRFEGTVDEDTLLVTPPGHFLDCNHYVAVSWCRSHDGSPKSAPAAPAKYVITNAGRKRCCKVPHHVLSRAIAFAAHYKVPFLWFDKECIDQKNATDQEIGIQSMDIVYQRSLYPLGLLQAYLDEQWQIDMIGLMVEGLPMTAVQMPQLLELLQMLKQDKWFTRAWILQESVSGGCEMTLLIQHEPTLHKTVTSLGSIDGEIEVTIQELRDALYWAHTCVVMCDEPVEPDLQKSLEETVDAIFEFIPSVITPPMKGFGDPDYRQTCNAAQAITVLRQKGITRDADRLAIIGNLCDYRLRIDTNELERHGFSFSVAAYALAILNGDLSLTMSDNPTGSSAIAFSWGPQKALRLTDLQHFEDDDDVVRVSPARFNGSGLLVKGYLWRIDVLCDFELGVETTCPDYRVLAWKLLKQLIQQDLIELAQTLWDFTSRFFMTPESSNYSDESRVPRQISELFELPDTTFIYRNTPWVQDESDFRVFFDDVGPRPVTTKTILGQNRPTMWDRTQWLWEHLLNHRSLPLATLVTNTSASHAVCRPSALFMRQLTSTRASNVSSKDQGLLGTYVFQPSTAIDQKLARTQRRGEPVFWAVKVNQQRDTASGCRLVQGTGEMLHGYCKPPADLEPELFVFT